VALLDLVVSEHLTTQVDRQLTARLALATTNRDKAFDTYGIQSNGARYGLGIYGEPIALWAVSGNGTLRKAALGDPLLPAHVRPPAGGSPLSLNTAIGTTTYRLQWRKTAAGWLLAAESLSELGHVEAVLVASEAIALPFLLAAFFLVAWSIGLRSARPVEVARRRQLEFTADASHELRTPISVIEAEVGLARSKRRNPEEYEATLDRIQIESTRLRRIVEDLLFLARADSEPAPSGTVPVDVAEVARRCGERFGAVAKANGQHLEVEAAAGSPELLFVTAPADWIDRLAGTLAENACAYAGAGARIRISAQAAAGNRVALRVEDDGPGIDPQARSEVVARFRRGSEQPGGHGLGLAIASSVTRQTGGSLTISRSDLGGALIEASWPRTNGKSL
jgi:signal transduction histidine kinase